MGDVVIRAAAEGTDTYELNRNLILTDGARADSVPNLEIETGEIVGAGHASATGRFDDEQLFYLMAVSYTHLDVYKRQVQGRDRAEAPDELVRLDRCVAGSQPRRRVRGGFAGHGSQSRAAGASRTLLVNRPWN